MIVHDHFLTGEKFELRETNIKGILKTYPVPTDLSRYYKSEKYISHHQDSNSLKERIYKFFQHFNLNYKRNTIAKEIGINVKILDYGCGAGEFVKFIENEYTTFGYEPNPEARAAAEKKTMSTRYVNSLEELPDHFLDCITLWHVFEHIENQEEILELLNKKLKPKGMLIIAVPNNTSYDAKKYKEFWAAYDVPRHIWHFSKSGMSTLMTTQNWTLKKIKPLLLDSYYISLLSEKYKKSAFFWFKGFLYGAISNFKAVKTGEFSSLIYIIKKK